MRAVSVAYSRKADACDGCFASARPAVCSAPKAALLEPWHSANNVRSVESRPLPHVLGAWAKLNICFIYFIQFGFIRFIYFIRSFYPSSLSRWSFIRKKFIRMKFYPDEGLSGWRFIRMKVYPDEVLANWVNVYPPAKILSGWTFIRMKFYPDEPPGGRMGNILSNFEKLANVQPRSTLELTDQTTVPFIAQGPAR